MFVWSPSGLWCCVVAAWADYGTWSPVFSYQQELCWMRLNYGSGRSWDNRQKSSIQVQARKDADWGLRQWREWERLAHASADLCPLNWCSSEFIPVTPFDGFLFTFFRSQKPATVFFSLPTLVFGRYFCFLTKHVLLFPEIEVSCTIGANCT